MEIPGRFARTVGGGTLIIKSLELPLCHSSLCFRNPFPATATVRQPDV